jgi:6-phosphofructokinase 1
LIPAFQPLSGVAANRRADVMAREKSMRKRRIGILTGGGDVPPLNAVIGAAQTAALKANLDLVGFLNGWQGVLDSNFVLVNHLKINPYIGGTFLKSSRVNLAHVPNGISCARHAIQQNRIDGLIVIGGEDTLSNALHLPELPQILISKTIDNDVGIIPKHKMISPPDIVNYFTLGYPTASRRISSFASLREGLRTTAYSHERIIILESMGMHAGWLALSSAFGNPDFIVIPEFPLDYDAFMEKVVERFNKEKNLIIVVAEGARWKNGNYVCADDSEKDDFGHPRFRGAAEALAKRLKEDLGRYFDTRNVNSVNPSYLYRSGTPCRLDLQWAKKLGKKAVELLSARTTASTFLTVRRDRDRFVLHPYPVTNVTTIEQLHRFVDDRLYDPYELAITRAGRNYLLPICEDIPREPYGLNKARYGPAQKSFHILDGANV